VTAEAEARAEAEATAGAEGARAAPARVLAAARRILGAEGLLSYLPTRRLVALLLVPVPVLLLGAGSGPAAAAAAAIDLAVLALAVADARRLPRRGDLAVERAARPVLSLGTRGRLEVRVRLAPGSVPVPGVRVREDLPPGIEAAGDPGPAPLVPGETAVFATPVTPLRRGRFPLGLVHLRADGPRGLVTRQYAFDRPAEARVLPSLAGVARYRLLALRGRLREAGHRQLRQRGAGSAFESLRDHLPGEDRRRVDWKATARRGRLIARNYEVERSQSVVLLVDAGRLMTAEARGGWPRLEHALNAAMVLAHVAASRDDRVGALVYADRVQGFAPPSRGRAGLERVAAVLGDAEPRMEEPDVEAAYRHLAARGRKRSLLVHFTEVVDPDSSAAILAHASRAAGRHLALVVTLRDLDLEETARAPAATAADAFRRAAAEELLQAREHALALLRRRGVSVLDAVPGALTAALVDRYLELKSRMLV
jgi:uncharacterized protein (DUF58 family)